MRHFAASLAQPVLDRAQPVNRRPVPALADVAPGRRCFGSAEWLGRTLPRAGGRAAHHNREYRQQRSAPPKPYAHVMPQENADLSFADFSGALSMTPFSDGAERLYPALGKKEGLARDANPSDSLVELGGIEPPTPRLPGRKKP